MVGQGAQEQHLGRSPASALTAEPSPQDAAVVHDQQVAGSEPSTDCGEPGLGQCRLSGPRRRPIEDQQAASVPRLGWRLGHGPDREVIVKFVDAEPRGSRIGHPQRLAANTAPGRMARPGAIGQEA